MKTYYTILIVLTIVLLNAQFIQSQWVQTNGPGGGYITSMAVIGVNVIVGANEGVFISSNNGTTWTSANNGLPSIPRIRSIAVYEANIILGCERTPIDPGGIYLSTDYGANWISKGLSNYSIISLALSGTDIFAGSDSSGVFLSTNNGTDWSKVNNGLPIAYVYALATSGNNIFAGTDSGVFITTDFGTKWTQVNNGLNYNLYVRSIAVDGNNVYVGTMNGLFLSTNNGANWAPVNNGLIDNMIISLASSGNTIYAGARGWPNSGGVYRSTDNGANWTRVNLSGYMILSLAADGNRIFAGALVFGGHSYVRGVFESVDYGETWAEVGLPFSSVSNLYVSGNNVYSCAFGSVYLSSNNGINWEDLHAPRFDLFNTYAVITIGSNIIVAGYRGLQSSTDKGLSWNSLPLSTPVYAFASSNNYLFAGGNYGVYFSTDNGSSWTEANNGLNSIDVNVRSLVISGSNIFAGTIPHFVNDTSRGGGLFISTNNGANWVPVNNGLTNNYINTLAVKGNNIFTGTAGGVFISSNKGTNWTQVNNGLTNINIRSIVVSGANIFAGTVSGLFISTNNGTNWKDAGLDSIPILSLAVNEDNIFAGTDGAGVWKRPLSDFALPVELTSFTVSNGKGSVLLKWRTATELNNMGFEVERSGNKSEWVRLDFVKGSGNSTSPISYSYVDKYAGKSGKYYYRLKQIDNDGSFKYSNVAEVEFGAPASFALNQNYPNPFNPSTRISYTLKDKGFVKLKVYDIRGELVKVLVNESKDAGYYESEFDGKGLASGVYIYRIEVIGEGNRSVYSDIKKTVLLK